MEAPAWDGKTVHVINMGSGHDRRQIEVSLTEDAARKLALAITKLKQTTIMLPPEVEELVTALNYVMVGDPASRAAHRVMEAGKGMTPDGGWRVSKADCAWCSSGRTDCPRPGH